jgi:hypothetical protein
MFTKISEERFASTIRADEFNVICHALMTGTAGSSKMLVCVYQNMEHHILEKCDLQSHCHGNFKSCKSKEEFYFPLVIR